MTIGSSDGPERLRGARARARTRRKAKDAEPPPKEEWQERAEKSIPDIDGAALKDAIGKGINAMRTRLANRLKAAAVTDEQKEVAGQFAQQCVAGDLEVFFLATGAELLTVKYKAQLVRWAPEVMFGVGLLMTFGTHFALSRAARDIAEKWAKDAGSD